MFKEKITCSVFDSSRISCSRFIILEVAKVTIESAYPSKSTYPWIACVHTGMRVPDIAMVQMRRGRLAHRRISTELQVCLNIMTADSWEVRTG